MPYFTHTENLNVIWRQHEFNAEALDGRIELISDTEPCYIVAHHPNKQWSYNVGWIEKITPEDGWEKLKLLGRKKNSKKPKLYYEMVPVNLYEKYVSRKGFVIKIETPKVDETVRIAKIPEARVVDLSTTEEPAPLPEVVTKNAKNLPREYSESSPREAFSGPATHVYRSPNQR